ncbi:Clp protease ClpP [Bacillus velezensis]|uniref:head maturation protease, ClpP-related n=1 Tax=Bacillus TaxID=1386 RepID=UPI001C532CA9|nr:MULTISPECIES: head maturation protease, ClpP-related [Bacillus amyloliquefaciens group]QXP99250.1 Clp protease ClpP [Bacillus velezensis]UHH01323.1 Clp protease ClpP [Bacillus amyloliquefaciens]ULR21071.1 Clp protease ClpP [Bacillus velezensis]UVW07814.1 Clp protease ClpP [Bacillus velezensis]WHL75120.1 Clp protease ClpP [Bacillus velezensis]
MSVKKAKKFWEVKATANDSSVGEVSIYSEIDSSVWWGDEVTAQTFKEDLDALGDVKTLNVYINSPGGDVFHGSAIYSILKRHSATVNVHVDGVAASIASVIAMAGDTIFMPANTMMMIHNPWTFAIGNSEELRKQADDMDKIRDSMIETYLGKAGEKLDKDHLIELLNAETWLTAQECLNLGLCDVVGEAKNVAANWNKELFAKYRNTPAALLNAQQTAPTASQSEKDRLFRERLKAEAETELMEINKTLGEL